MKRNKRQLYVMIFVFAMIALAYTCRMLDMYDIGSGYPGDVRAALYIVLLALWGYSIDRRIIQKPVLHCLRLTDALMLLWLILRTLKYEVVTDLGMLPVKRTIKNNKFLYRQPCYGWRYFMLLLYIAHDISLVSLHAVSFEVVGCCSNLCN